MDAGNPPLIREETEDWMADTVLGAEDPVVRVVSDSEALFNDALCPLALLSPLTEENGDADTVVADCVADMVMEDTVVEKDPALDAVSREDTGDSVADVDEDPVGVVSNSETPPDTLRPLALLPLLTEEPGGTDAVVMELLPLIREETEGAPGTVVARIDWERLLDCELCGPVTPLELLPLIMLLPVIWEEIRDPLADTFGNMGLNDGAVIPAVIEEADLLGFSPPTEDVKEAKYAPKSTAIVWLNRMGKASLGNTENPLDCISELSMAEVEQFSCVLGAIFAVDLSMITLTTKGNKEHITIWESCIC
ncbi:hypothetical protein B0H13DRAFT_2352812 [Mycena leptocephala]|nr:hypothetical protein B0H13DRAFT_2352812 [Mycena leptocephala]